jgi:hyperosmotically inducible periplasmic protein
MAIKRFTGLIALALAPAIYASSANAPLGTLENKVRHELVMLPYYNIFDDLSFRVDNGTVTLFGSVTDPVLKSDAQRVVQRVEGVTQVKNQIEVLPLSPFDNQIRYRTYRAIFGYGPLQRYALGANPSIHIIVKNGNVTLIGAVSSKMDSTLVNLRANSVPGVFSVTNRLQVDR